MDSRNKPDSKTGVVRQLRPGEAPPSQQPESLCRRPLPEELSSFVGRECEVAQVTDLLSRRRLVTVTGMGGMGKTRVALKVARGLEASLAHGVCLIELANLRDSALLASAVGTALGLDDRAEPSLQRVVDYLGDRSVLLVLDSCEHVLAAAADVVTELLESCPKLRVLVTSRRPLGVAGEVVFPLASMKLPPACGVDDPQCLMRFEAIRLFVERAMTAVPDFRLTSENAVTVMQLCRRLDGLPLAIELAAGRLRALDIEQLLEQLARRHEVLRAVGPRRGRQHTLRATLDLDFPPVGGHLQ